MREKEENKDYVCELVFLKYGHCMLKYFSKKRRGIGYQFSALSLRVYFINNQVVLSDVSMH